MGTAVRLRCFATRWRIYRALPGNDSQLGEEPYPYVKACLQLWKHRGCTLERRDGNEIHAHIIKRKSIFVGKMMCLSRSWTQRRACTIAAVDISRHLPDRERLSAVMALILLAYAMARFVQLPGRTLALQLGGIYLPLLINTNTIVAVLVAGLTAAGADWLLRGEPGLSSQSTVRHWLLPGMTAWILSLTLANLQFNLYWWIAFTAAGFLILAILIAEYSSSFKENRFHQTAIIALNALTYGLFLILTITIRGLGLRLYLAFPAIAVGSFLAATRLQLLLDDSEWRPMQMVAITFIVAQIAATLHYLPISALGYGLILLGLFLALNTYFAALNQGQEPRQAAREPVVALAVFWLLAALIR